ncbi:MAG: hypothetical protein AAFY29_17870 [Pseudomonadota bacterium]
MIKDTVTFCTSRIVRGMAQVLGLGLALGGAAAVHADAALPSDKESLIENAFSQVAVREVRALGERRMIETEGDLWPRAFSSPPVSRPLATYAWTIVVPGVTAPWGGGECTSCAGRNHIPR